MRDRDLDDTMFGSPGPKAKPRRRKTPKKDLEGPVVKECLTFLHLLPEVKYIERRNTGAVAFADGGFIRFGSKGAADIWCLMQPRLTCPIHVEIECKRRDGKGRLSPAQVQFRELCREIGVDYLVVTSAEELAKKFHELGLTS